MVIGLMRVPEMQNLQLLGKLVEFMKPSPPVDSLCPR